jgi:DNA-binding transcriptional LysR family regulator
MRKRYTMATIYGVWGMATSRRARKDETAADNEPPARDSPPRSRLKLAHLRLMVALEEHEMVSAAAAAMNLSQPAASRMLAEMEQLLDAPLCERQSRGVRLTTLGVSLARHARSILLQLATAEQEFSDLRTGRTGSVALGVVTAPAIDLVAPSVNRLRTLYPKIELNIRIDTSNALARDLLASRLDFAIARIPEGLDPNLFDSHTIGVEDACLVVRAGHPLLGKGPQGVKELGAWDWVLQPRGTPLRRTIENLFIAQNIAVPARLSNTSSLLLTMIMVANSNAIAPLSVEAAKFIDRGDTHSPIRILPTAFEIVVQPYSLISVRDRAMSPAARSVYEVIRREAKGGRKVRRAVGSPTC